MRATGLFVEHPNGQVVDTSVVMQTCPRCPATFRGPAKVVIDKYRDHMVEEHIEQLEECGCCGCFHLQEFDGDCREDWERF